MCKGSRGLLTKIVDVMKKEPTTSTFRLWFVSVYFFILSFSHTISCSHNFTVISSCCVLLCTQCWLWGVVHSVLLLEGWCTQCYTLRCGALNVAPWRVVHLMLHPEAWCTQCCTLNGGAPNVAPWGLDGQVVLIQTCRVQVHTFKPQIKG